ncbi:unnamed protein product [Schistosoma margrebowiei]|uniref:Uncharacterized protein n=1 Tax=Schistosoma margrebowiei TaxID=48269 RepID=A0A183LIG7_9TREM|nr:unnamed protein product [Schistosoma margrebowiei]
MKTPTSEGKHGIQWTASIIIDEQNGSAADVNVRIGKARAAYLQMRNIRNSKQVSTNTKVRIFNTNIKTVLLYGAATWKTTKTIIQKKQVVINIFLRKNKSRKRAKI